MEQSRAIEVVDESAEVNAVNISLDLHNARLDRSDMTKNPNAVALGKLGGKARAEKLSAAQLSEIGKKAAAARHASLSSAERKRIAKLAVAARERKRKQAQEKGKQS
jgi:hypothetical protein